MKYKVGDRVKVKSYIELYTEGEKRNFDVSRIAEYYAHRVVTIKSANYPYYSIEHSPPTAKLWIHWMFEGLATVGPVNHIRYTTPTHYNLSIDPYTYAHENNLGFLEGNVVKYVTRHKQKNGKEDLEKAIETLKRLIELEYDENDSK